MPEQGVQRERGRAADDAGARRGGDERDAEQHREAERDDTGDLEVPTHCCAGLASDASHCRAVFAARRAVYFGAGIAARSRRASDSRSRASVTIVLTRAATRSRSTGGGA